MRSLITHYVVHHAVDQKEIFHQEFYPYLTCGLFCVCYNGYECVLYVFYFSTDFSIMPPKRRQTSTALLTPSAKRTRSATRTTIQDSTSAHATPPDTSNFRELSLSDLASLPAKTLRSQLKTYKLPPVGNKLQWLIGFIYSSILHLHQQRRLHPPRPSMYLGR